MSEKTSDLTSRTEQRVVIKHCVRSGMTPLDTLKFLNCDKSKKECSRALVFRWHKRFSEGEDNVDDKKRSGRPRSIGKRRVSSIEAIIRNDGRRTVREISDITNCKRTALHEVMKKELKLSKVSA